MKNSIFVLLLISIFLLVVACTPSAEPLYVPTKGSNYKKISRDIGIYGKYYYGHPNYWGHDTTAYFCIVKMKFDCPDIGIGIQDTTFFYSKIDHYLTEWKEESATCTFRYEGKIEFDDYVFINTYEDENGCRHEYCYIVDKKGKLLKRETSRYETIQEINENYFLATTYAPNPSSIVLDRNNNLSQVFIKGNDYYFVDENSPNSFDEFEMLNQRLFIVKIGTSWFLLDNRFRYIAWSKEKFKLVNDQVIGYQSKDSDHTLSQTFNSRGKLIKESTMQNVLLY